MFLYTSAVHFFFFFKQYYYDHNNNISQLYSRQRNVRPGDVLRRTARGHRMLRRAGDTHNDNDDNIILYLSITVVNMVCTLCRHVDRYTKYNNMIILLLLLLYVHDNIITARVRVINHRRAFLTQLTPMCPRRLYTLASRTDDDDGRIYYIGVLNVGCWLLGVYVIHIFDILCVQLYTF